MGWFDEQIRTRINNDEEIFSDSFVSMINMLEGREVTGLFYNYDKRQTEKSIGEILNYFHIPPKEVPDNIKNIEEILEFLLRPAGIMSRRVKLTEGWYRDAAGAMLGVTQEGQTVALIPLRSNCYAYKDPKTDKLIKINAKNEKNIRTNAVCFYKPLPPNAVTEMSIVKYIFSLLRFSDYLLLLILSAFITAIGLFIPVLYGEIYDKVTYLTTISGIIPALVALATSMISGIILKAVKNITMTNLRIGLNVSVESAVMMRLLSLSPNFFKSHSSGDVASRVIGISNLCEMLFDAMLSTGITMLFSFTYFIQIFNFVPALFVPSMIISTISLLFTSAVAVVQTKTLRQKIEETGKEASTVISMINGIKKIKTAGAEKRMFAKWSKHYVAASKYRYNPPFIIKYHKVISLAITLFGTIILYFSAVKASVSVSDFMAFNIALGFFNGALDELSASNLVFAGVKPALERLRPILEAKSEISEKKTMVTSLHGAIEINNLSFRYDETQPYVLDNISLKIKPRQYVAIVGKTGCGKSTLMKILLGFETPQKGGVYYDRKDINSIDLLSLRKKIGVVMQNGKLFSGDILSNITVCAPWLTLDEAWEAAERAGLADDIRKMPMGMNTRISEGQGGISGGQKQRLMIARAIAPKPAILMFDEATSALDNITQKIVSDSLAELNCTRIVIAHRLSTIRQCDRIILLDDGKIAGDGTYEELLKNNRLFQELIERQRISQ